MRKRSFRFYGRGSRRVDYSPLRFEPAGQFAAAWDPLGVFEIEGTARPGAVGPAFRFAALC